MLNLYLGRCGEAKSDRMLCALCKAGEDRPQVLIVPEQQSHEAEWALCQTGGSGVSLYGEVLPFSRLAVRVFEKAGGLCVQELNEGGKLLSMYLALKSVSDSLRVFSKAAVRPVFLKALLDTVDELKREGILPEELHRMSSEMQGSRRERFSDLAVIFGEYQRRVEQGRLDPVDRLSRAADKLRECDWAQGKDIWVDGFERFTYQQMEILRQLMRQANSVNVALTCGERDARDEAEIFSVAHVTAQRLRRAARSVGVPVREEWLTIPDTEKDPALERLSENLFADAATPAVCCRDSVELLCAADQRREVEWAAERILELVYDQGYRFRDIEVTARDYGVYRELVETIFSRYDIPLFSSAMSDILRKPVLALVTAALDTVASHYNGEDVFRYLKTGMTDLSLEDCDLLENYAVKWNIRGSRWTQESDWTWPPGGYGEKMNEADAQLLAKLDRLRRGVVAGLRELERPSKKTGREQARKLRSFLEHIGLKGRIEQRMKALAARGEQALAEEYRQLWDILCDALHQCEEVLDGQSMEMEEFSRLFQMMLSQYEVGSIPVCLDQVTAGEMGRQTGHRIKVLLLLGADDASLPRVTAPGSLLTDEDWEQLRREAERLCDKEIGKGVEQWRIAEEMTNIYLTCVRPSRRLLVSWPMQTDGGEERRASFLIGRLQLLFSDLEIKKREDEMCLPQAVLPALEAAGQNPTVRRALELLPEHREKLEAVRRAARWERGSLSRSVVEQLYGTRIPMSASRMDRCRSCHFLYFMQYGLKAKPRRPAGFDAPEYGTFVHYVLEHIMKDPLFQREKEGRTTELDEQTRQYLRRRIREAVEHYVAEELGGLEGQSERFRYLFNRLLRAVQAVAENVAEEMLRSDFRPISFELGFGRTEALPPVELSAQGMTLSVSGFVDRVDGWVHDGKLYLRVVDYKTGRKSFDFTDVWNGLSLQMLLYLFALEERGESLYGMPVESAGVLYLPARDVVIQGERTMPEERRRAEMAKQLRRSGLVLQDDAVLRAMEKRGDEAFRFLPLTVTREGTVAGDALVSAERLGRLNRHVHNTLREICEELACGNIAADPFWRGAEKNPCMWCDYAEACHFEEGRSGDRRRWLKTLSRDDFWIQMEQEENEEDRGELQ